MQPPAEPASEQNAEARSGRGCDHGGVAFTLVIVDDHAGFRSFGRARLEADGVTVVGEAEDGASAVLLCRRLDPDVVLLDVDLPDFDGFEVCARLGSGTAGRPAVVLTSSRPATAYTSQLRATTARGFLPKEEVSGDTIRALVRTDS